MTTNALATQLVRRYALTAADLVIEVGSGAGEFLRAVRDLGPRVLGVESDRQVLGAAFRAGVDTVCATFTPATAARLRTRYGPARVIVTRSGPVADEVFLITAASCLTPFGVVLLVTGSAVAECRPFEPVLSRAA